MATQVTLSSPVTIQVTQPKSITVSTLTVLKIIDNPNRKKVKVRVKELGRPVTIWEDADYDSNANYTKADVLNRLTQVVQTMGL